MAIYRSASPVPAKDLSTENYSSHALTFIHIHRVVVH